MSAVSGFLAAKPNKKWMLSGKTCPIHMYFQEIAGVVSICILLPVHVLAKSTSSELARISWNRFEAPILRDFLA